MSVKWLVIVVPAMILTSLSVAAEDLSQTKVLKEIERKASAVKTYTVTAEMVMGMGELKEVPQEEKDRLRMMSTMSTRIWYKHPDRLRKESTHPGGDGGPVSIVSGDTEWNIIGGHEEPMIIKIDWKKLGALTKGKRFFTPEGTDIAHPFMGVWSPKLLGKEMRDDKQCYVFKGMPGSSPGAEVGPSVKLWIKVKDGLLTRSAVCDPEGKEQMSTTYRDLKTNVDIPDEKFVYVPPEGAKVQNYTDMFGE